jgi:transposase
MKDYTGKTLYVGIDVHKKTYAVTCICEKEIVKRDKLKAVAECLVEYLHKYFKGAKIETVYEAGFCGFTLHRYLLSKGINSMVVHAASVEISARDRVKTDKRDSLKLAVQLSDGRLRGIHVPTPQREAYREISRLREKVAKDKRRAGNRLKSLLCRQGLLTMDNDKSVSEKWLTEVAQYTCDESVKICIEICIDKWLFLKKTLKKIDDELQKQALADIDLEKIYRSAPGIGAIHARVLANELEDMKHFSNEKQLFSYTGLTPSEYSSGDHKRLGHISRQGRSILRKTLIQAAWVAIKYDPSLRINFERIAATAGKKRAIVGIARRLIGQIRSCLKSNTLYQLRNDKVIEFCQETGEVLTDVNKQVLLKAC